MELENGRRSKAYGFGLIEARTTIIISTLLELASENYVVDVFYSAVCLEHEGGC